MRGGVLIGWSWTLPIAKQFGPLDREHLAMVRSRILKRQLGPLVFINLAMNSSEED